MGVRVSVGFRTSQLLFACLLAGSVLGACVDESRPAPPSPNPGTTQAPAPTAVATPVPVATAATPTQQQVTPRPALPTATPPPTAEELAIEELAGILAWYPEERGWAVRTKAFEILLYLMLLDPELGQLVAGLPWIQDKISGRDDHFLEGVRAASSGDIALLRWVLSSLWVRDGLPEEELRFFHFLVRTDEASRDVVEALSDFVPQVSSAPPTLRSQALAAIQLIGRRNMNNLVALTQAPWFRDGLSVSEVAFITTLPGACYDTPYFYEALLDEFYSQSTTVTLDRAGDVTIWVFQNTPFPQDEPLMERIAAAARAAESFFQRRFPTDHIILLVSDPTGPGFPTGGWHFGPYMQLPRRDGEVPNVAHETAHYYFRSRPFWLAEGAANYFEYHVVAEEDPVARRAEVEDRATSCLGNTGAENIRHYQLLSRNAISIGGSNCEYYLGEHFLLRAGDVMGTSALAAALQELFPPSRGVRLRDGDEEEEIYKTFLKHLPEGKEEAFTTLYRELHGGFEGFEVPPEPDDHGDSPARSTPLSVGERAEGHLDYSYDNDYFSILLDGGAKYEVIFEHAVGTSRLALFDGAKLIVGFETEARVFDRYIVAPKTGTYHFAVQNFGGEPAPYSLLVRVVPPAEDDHGDSLGSATEVTLGEKMVGVLHDSTDFDYFRFPTKPYGVYTIDVEHRDRQVFRVRLLKEDGESYETYVLGEFEFLDATSISFKTTLGGGEHYIVVDGAQEKGVSYSLTVTVGEELDPE